MALLKTDSWQVSDDCKATLLLCHEFGEGRLQGDAKPLSTWEYAQLVRFLQELGTRPSAVLQAETAEPILRRLPPDLPANRVRNLLARGLSLSLAMETWRSRGIWVISRADPSYPSRLKDRFRLEAPPVLFGVGNPTFLNSGGLGVFGSRNVDEEGFDFAYKVGTRCADESITVLSGCARGVDWAAMSGSLEAGGLAIGVIAEKLDRASLSVQYRQYIREERLVLISMFAPEAPFTIAHAKGRDKYTYALSDHALVVSAERDKGGTWAGATEQLTRLRHVPVFVRSEGTLPSGNPALLALGGQPFPTQTLQKSFSKFFFSVETSEAQKAATLEEPPAKAAIPEVVDQGEIFPEVAAASASVGKPRKKAKKSKGANVPATELAQFAQKLIKKYGAGQISAEDAAALLGVSREQAATWLKHDSIS